MFKHPYKTWLLTNQNAYRILMELFVKNINTSLAAGVGSVNIDKGGPFRR